ncbi:Kynurenine 3-monooxygenase [Alphaproteobacteria bacterium SO-S41]|nr:Kynurenine 3-monooxygenase [Alphaproteobacteria bacterium SO-S41]
MTEKIWDLVIVGGGIAGSALAITMARAGRSVLVLEKSMVFEDRVRGEWISPWGVREVKRVGLYDLLVKAGGHHLDRHITYDETKDIETAEAAPLPLSMFVEGVPGPLCIGHPHHCQTLFDEATRAGAATLRGVDILMIVPANTPAVTFTHQGETHTVRARLLIGADGRQSAVREAAGIPLNQDKPHHWFAGMLVDGVTEWDDKLQAIGTEGDFAFLAFPQGDGRVRIYGSFALEQRGRFAGPTAQYDFLRAFELGCSPANRHIAEGQPAGPVLSYFNNDSWTDTPYRPGVVLIGDAAGWNDPIIGLGLSITYRDVRIVSEILKETDDWSALDFAPYAEERAERMRRLRFAASLTSSIDAEFGEKAKARRKSFFERAAADPTLGIHGFAIMAGPENLPPEYFTPEHRARVLGETA